MHRSHHSFTDRYPRHQIFAVIMVTFGIILATYASSISLNKEKTARNIQSNDQPPDYFRLAIGMKHLS